MKRTTFMLAGLLAMVAASCIIIPGNADQPNTWLEGKPYSKSADGKLYPMVDGSWTDAKGVKHEHWIVDYSSYKAPVANPNFQPQNPQAKNYPPIKPANAAPKPEQPISVRDEGCKHYLTVGADALFDFDKYELTDKAQQTLKLLIPMIRKYGKHQIVVEGHTDSVGTDDYNQTLSENRARTVGDWLSANGIDRGALIVQGLGKKNPVAPNTYTDGTDYPQGRAKNRRVVVCVDTCKETSEVGGNVQ